MKHCILHDRLNILSNFGRGSWIDNDIAWIFNEGVEGSYKCHSAILSFYIWDGSFCQEVKHGMRDSIRINYLHLAEPRIQES